MSPTERSIIASRCPRLTDKPQKQPSYPYRFQMRVNDAKVRLAHGWDRREVRAIHGSVVLQAAEGRP